jgi:hypothetical protein
VPRTQNIWTILIFTVLAVLWFERIRQRTLAEFPDEPPPRLPGLRGRPVTESGGSAQ